MAVSIHAPGRGATVRPRLRRLRLPVSIHAPGRGATNSILYTILITDVSIHAPGRGATATIYLCPYSLSRFNSRTREGCDLTNLCAFATTYVVSIHAPGRGATCTYLRHSPIDTSFNSRTREGCDMACSLRTRLSTCFNSRTREGCDSLDGGLKDYVTGFQFTHPGGVRLVTSRNVARAGVFQFTHPGGVRLSRPTAVGDLDPVSIHAPGRGATQSGTSKAGNQWRFNSRTREGCDICRIRGWSVSLRFQFTHPGGVRRPPQGRRRDPREVSIHAPGRGATQTSMRRRAKSSGFQFTHPGGVRPTQTPPNPKYDKFQFTHPGGVRRRRAGDVEK